MCRSSCTPSDVQGRRLVHSLAPHFAATTHAALQPPFPAPPSPAPSPQPALIDMVSAGTLAVFAVVALALLWHRYVDSKNSTRQENMHAMIGVSTLAVAGIGTRRRRGAPRRARARLAAARGPRAAAAGPGSGSPLAAFTCQAADLPRRPLDAALARPPPPRPPPGPRTRLRSFCVRVGPGA